MNVIVVQCENGVESGGPCACARFTGVVVLEPKLRQRGRVV